VNVGRIAVAPPWARDRLIWFTGVNKNFVHSLELSNVPRRAQGAHGQLERIGEVINTALDPGLLVWLAERRAPTDEQRDQALPVFGERLTRSFFSGRGTLRRASRSGVWGDPHASNAELGRGYLDQIEDATIRFVEYVEQMFEGLPERTQ